MINTNDTARHEIFTVGADNPEKRILIVSSCRGLPHLNYLNRFNEAHGRPFQISFINPNELWYDSERKERDIEIVLARMERDPAVRGLIEKTDIFIHEHHQRFGMWNTTTLAEKHIYQFGMKPTVDISIPNFHDHFILFNDVLAHNPGLRGMAKEDLARDGKLSLATRDLVVCHSAFHQGRFYGNCSQSDFPEFATWFEDTWTQKRLFSTFNHVGKEFTLELFRRVNDRFLELPLDEKFWAGARSEDLFASPRTPITSYDVEAFGLTWDEPTSPLSL